MKRVSFNTAKALKEVGYPQYGHCNEFYDSQGKVVDKMCDMHKLVYPCPTYFDVWLWLWREKKKWIDVNFSLDENNWTFMQNPSPCNCGLYNDPEEALIAAIDFALEYLNTDKTDK